MTDTATQDGVELQHAVQNGSSGVPDRSKEAIPEEWTDEYEEVNAVAQAYIDWMNGEISKQEYCRIKRQHRRDGR